MCVGKETDKREDRSTRRNPTTERTKETTIFLEEIAGSEFKDPPVCQTS